MRHCPVCEKEQIQGFICENCGFDLSCDYEGRRTLCSVLPKGAEPVSVRAAKWQQQQKQVIALAPGVLVCPKCRGEDFSFLINEMQFMCADCGWKKPVAPSKDGSVSESDPFVENKTADTSDDSPVTNPVPAKADTAPADTDEAPPVSNESSRGGRDPEPAARAGQGGFRKTSGLLPVYFWIYLAAAAGLVLLAWIIGETYQLAIWAVPGMLLSAVFYAVSAVFVLRCRRRIREQSDVGSADSVQRTAIFFGTLVLIHVLITAVHQYIVWFGPDLLERLPVMFPSAAFCAVSDVLVFRCRHHIRVILDAGLADDVRRTAVFFGTLILIRVLLGVIHQVIMWLDPGLLYPVYDWLEGLWH